MCLACPCDGCIVIRSDDGVAFNHFFPPASLGRVLESTLFRKWHKLGDAPQVRRRILYYMFCGAALIGNCRTQQPNVVSSWDVIKKKPFTTKSSTRNAHINGDEPTLYDIWGLEKQLMAFTIHTNTQSRIVCHRLCSNQSGCTLYPKNYASFHYLYKTSRSWVLKIRHTDCLLCASSD